MDSSAPVPVVRAGRVASPHGLDGSVKVAEPVPGLLAIGATVEVGGRRLEISRRSGTDAKPIIRFSGCDTREAAVSLRGLDILVNRVGAPQLDEGEYWTVDLIGLQAVDGSETVGKVVEVLGLPSCEVLEVERPEASNLLVPFVSDAVRKIDLAAGTVDIDLAFLGERK